MYKNLVTPTCEKSGEGPLAQVDVFRRVIDSDEQIWRENERFDEERAVALKRTKDNTFRNTVGCIGAELTKSVPSPILIILFSSQ